MVIVTIKKLLFLIWKFTKITKGYITWPYRADMLVVQSLSHIVYNYFGGQWMRNRSIFFTLDIVFHDGAKYTVNLTSG